VQKAQVGKYAAEHGLMNSIRCFQEHFVPDIKGKYSLWLEG